MHAHGLVKRQGNPTRGGPFPRRRSVYGAHVAIEGCPDELLLSGVAKPGEKPIELARQSVRVPELEADAIAVPDTVKNPVDLGTILVPSGWLLLGPDQRGVSRVRRDQPDAQLASNPAQELVQVRAGDGGDDAGSTS